MNRPEKDNNDNLRQYIDPKSIERAPAGFTSNVMTKIRFETDPLKDQTRVQSRNHVPFISTIITLILILLVFILPESKNGTGIISEFRFLQNADLPVFNFNLDSLFNLNLPVWTAYLFIGILILVLLDKVLSGLSYRE